MEVKLLGEKRAVMVKIDGELDHHIANTLRETVDSKIRCSNAVNVIFDFSNVGFMDSSGIGVIMGRYKTVKTLGGSVIIFGQNSQIKRIVEMSGIDRIVRVADTLDEALKMI
jgi:stage II sporulation protein AA (anti-sigma F factor antagonist)